MFLKGQKMEILIRVNIVLNCMIIGILTGFFFMSYDLYKEVKKWKL